MPVIPSTIDTQAPAFARNTDAMKRLLADLHSRLEVTRRGGNEEARTRHTGRGKLLVRDRGTAAFGVVGTAPAEPAGGGPDRAGRSWLHVPWMHEKAVLDFTEALKFRPREARLRILRGKAYLESARDCLRKGRRQFRKNLSQGSRATRRRADSNKGFLGVRRDGRCGVRWRMGRALASIPD